MDKLYSADGADYRLVHPKKLTSYKKAKYKGADLLNEINGQDVPRRRSKGSAADVIGAWKHFYIKGQGGGSWRVSIRIES